MKYEGILISCIIFCLEVVYHYSVSENMNPHKRKGLEMGKWEERDGEEIER